MKSTFRWIPTITRKHTLAGLAALSIATAITGGLATAAVAAPSTGASTAAVAPATQTAPAAAKTPAAPVQAVAAAKTLNHSFQLQSNGYFCGPSATRVALSAHGKVYTQDKVAHLLGTTVDGTSSANDVTRVLNAQLGPGRYHTVEISTPKASPAQVNQLKTDVITAINHGDPVVANIAGTITDTHGDTHSYEGGHYLPIIGYTHHGNTVKIADSADTVGSPYYSVNTNTMTNWIATRGYAA